MPVRRGPPALAIPALREPALCAAAAHGTGPRGRRQRFRPLAGAEAEIPEAGSDLHDLSPARIAPTEQLPCSPPDRAEPGGRATQSDRERLQLSGTPPHEGRGTPRHGEVGCGGDDVPSPPPPHQGRAASGRCGKVGRPPTWGVNAPDGATAIACPRCPLHPRRIPAHAARPAPGRGSSCVARWQSGNLRA
jgi:hypothetical protein